MVVLAISHDAQYIALSVRYDVTILRSNNRCEVRKYATLHKRNCGILYTQKSLYKMHAQFMCAKMCI